METTVDRIIDIEILIGVGVLIITLAIANVCLIYHTFIKKD